MLAAQYAELVHLAGLEPEISTHTLKKINSHKRFGMHMDLDYVSPLYTFAGEPAGAIVIEHADIFATIGPSKSSSPNRFL